MFRLLVCLFAVVFLGQKIDFVRLMDIVREHSDYGVEVNSTCTLSFHVTPYARRAVVAADLVQ